MTQFLRDQASDSEEVVTPLMLDGTYLSRNFATLGPLIGQPPCGCPRSDEQKDDDRLVMAEPEAEPVVSWRSSPHLCPSTGSLKVFHGCCWRTCSREHHEPKSQRRVERAKGEPVVNRGRSSAASHGRLVSRLRLFPPAFLLTRKPDHKRERPAGVERALLCSSGRVKGGRCHGPPIQRFLSWRTRRLPAKDQESFGHLLSSSAYLRSVPSPLAIVWRSCHRCFQTH